MNSIPDSPQRRSNRVGTALAAASAAVAIAVLSGCSPSSAPAPANREEARPALLNLDPAVGWVGREACRKCHFEIYSTYVNTGMGRSFYPMDPEIAVGDFTQDNEIVAEAGLHYRMERRGDEYYQRQYVLDSAGRETLVEEHELRYVVGSNHHSRSYVLEADGRLFQAPVCWYPQASKWDLCPGFEHKNDHFVREISRSCLFCHNGKMQAVGIEENRFEQPYPRGIGCERCHGPGQLHVERWSSGRETPTGGPDPTIVHPRRLPRRERLDVCLQCHFGDSKASERVVRHGGRAGEPFRPGLRLTEHVVPFRYTHQTQFDFGLSAQGDRMMLSRCFTESDGKLECLTCHNPHVSVYHPERPVERFRENCLGCHAGEDCTAPGDARASTPQLPDDCVACHMRKAEPDDQRYTEFTDHWIRRDIDVERRDPRRSYEIEPVFPEDFAARGAGEQAFYRARANALLAPEATPEGRAEMLTSAVAGFEQAIAGGFESAEVWFFLGVARLDLGRLREALAAFERSHALDPNRTDAAFELGQAMLAAGRTERALELFEAILGREPDNPMVLSEIGRARTAEGKVAEALAFYERARDQVPWKASVRHNLGMLLASLGRYDEAAREGDAAARLNPDDPEVLDFLSRIREAAGDPEGATEARRLAERLKKPGAGP